MEEKTNNEQIIEFLERINIGEEITLYYRTGDDYTGLYMGVLIANGILNILMKKKFNWDEWTYPTEKLITISASIQVDLFTEQDLSPFVTR